MPQVIRCCATIRKSRIIAAGVCLFTLIFCALTLSRVYSVEYARNRIYTADTVASYPVAIIFGAWVDPNGNPSAILQDRVKAGVNLYKTGKVRVLLLTGDNHVTSYNEPEAMRRYAQTLGVPDSALVLDYAGFRTYDSCYRARAVFQVERAILVRQAFHLDRALLTCNNLGIDSVGVAADAVRPEGYNRFNLLTSQLREFPSTAFALIDLFTGRKPTCLGDPLPIKID